MKILNKLDARLASEDVGKLVLRVTLGVLMLLHGIHKGLHFESINSIGSLFENHGLPAVFAYLVYIGEIIAPLMIIVGFKTKLGAKLIAITMIVAIWLVHTSHLFILTDKGGAAIELQLMYLLVAVAVASLGAGKYSIDKK